MRYWCIVWLTVSAVVANVGASTVNWSAGIHHGFSLENGAELPVGSLVRLGWFRDPQTGVQLTDAQIQGMKTSLSSLDAAFVEAGSTTIGSGFAPAIPGHFGAVTVVDVTPSLAGRQMYIWVLNAPNLHAADEQAILYWSITDTVSNPNGSPDVPGVRWRFPESVLFPGSTTIDVSDLTVGTGSLAAGARLVVGTYPTGTSTASGFANFGLSNLYQPPVVVSPTILAGGSVGAVYQETLQAAEGTPPFIWEVTGGELPNGLVMNSAGVISGRPTFAGTFSFIVRATDLVGSFVSREVSITIASVPLVISSPSVLPEVGVNDLYALTLSAFGGTAPYSWELASGALPDGMTLSAGGLLSGTPSVTGVAQFVVKCIDAGALATTKAMSLNILDLGIVTGSSLKNGIFGLPYVLQLEAIGGRPPYSWSLTGGAMPPGQLPGSILNANGIISFTPSAEGLSTFTLEVRDSMNLTASRQFTLEVLRVEVVPSIERPDFPEGTVGASYSYRLRGSSNATQFRASGLPPGMVLDQTTGWITGRPRKSGRFPVVVRTSNSAGRSQSATAILPILPFSGGRFIGSIAHNSNVNGNLGGRLDLTTSSTGAYSLRLTHGGVVRLHRGRIDRDDSGRPTIDFPVGQNRVSLVVEGMLISGTIGTGTAGGASASVYGWRSVWNATKNPAIQYRGYYSAGIDLQSVPLAEVRPIPMGTGFLYFDVRRNGTLAVLGRAADGSSLVTRGFIGPDGEVLVHRALYKNRGSITGRLQIQPDADGDLLKNEVEGSLTWIKPAFETRVYAEGFGPLSLGVFGRYLTREGKGFLVSGLPEVNVASLLQFTEGGIESASINPDVTFQYTDRRRVLMPVAGSAANPGRTSLRIPFVRAGGAGSNGLISGGFRLVDGDFTRNAKFQGMIIRGLDSSKKAYGYFLLPQLPTGSERLSQTPILSGQVIISQ